MVSCGALGKGRGGPAAAEGADRMGSEGMHVPGSWGARGTRRHEYSLPQRCAGRRTQLDMDGDLTYLTAPYARLGGCQTPRTNAEAG